MIQALIIIGESINDSVPSTHKLYEANDIAGLKELAKSQDAGGAAYIDVNVGNRPPEFLAEMVRQVQSVTRKPLSIDTPDPSMAEAALKAYDLQRAAGQAPVLNSISQLRSHMFELNRIMPFKPILLVTEREENGAGQPNHTPIRLMRRQTNARRGWQARDPRRIASSIRAFRPSAPIPEDSSSGL